MNYAEYRDLIRSKGKGVVVFRKLDNTIENIKNKIINANSGRILFTKNSGETRELFYNVAVGNSLLKGGKSSVSHISKYLPLYDVKNNKWVNVNCETILEVGYD